MKEFLEGNIKDFLISNLAGIIEFMVIQSDKTPNHQSINVQNRNRGNLKHKKQHESFGTNLLRHKEGI